MTPDPISTDLKMALRRLRLSRVLDTTTRDDGTVQATLDGKPLYTFVRDMAPGDANGEGSTGLRGGPPGDLYVVVRLREHDLFVRNGDDLYCDLPVTFPQLVSGGELQVPLLSGAASLKIPAGSQPHQILKLRGRGMPRLRERGHGDACYRLLLEIPQKLNATQREALQAFEAASKGQGGPLLTSFLERMKKLLG